MKLLKNKNKSIICFDKNELSELFKIDRKYEILQEIGKQKISFHDLRNDFSKAKDIIDSPLLKKKQNDRDEHEIFAALFVFYDFFEEESEICFEIKNKFNPNKDKINNLKDLNQWRDGSISDFIIKSKDGLREFQLKRYRGKLNTDDIFSFIKTKVQHYGNDLGNTNLLLLFQPQPFTVNNINFRELSDKVKSLNFKSEGEILLTFNKENKELWIVRLYPEFASTKKPFILPSER